MDLEILTAVNFLLYLMTNNLYYIFLTKKQLYLYRNNLMKILLIRCQRSWNILFPYENSSTRFIKIDRNIDNAILEAAKAANINSYLIKKFYPKKLFLYIDPNEVTYLTHNVSCIAILYEKHKNSDAWSPNNKQEIYTKYNRNIFCLHSKNNISYHTKHFSAYERVRKTFGNHVSIEDLAHFVTN